jgi:ribosomal protein S18 acetylase RimI-like enzyme
MVRIASYRPKDFAAVVAFVGALQDYERAIVPALRPGHEIAQPYAEMLSSEAAARDGCILLAWAQTRPIGFVCAWCDEDDDMLLQDEFRRHAYISDIYVETEWRQRGVASKLLSSVEDEMRNRGCARIRICSKAANDAALGCYRRAGGGGYELILEKALLRRSKRRGGGKWDAMW